MNNPIPLPSALRRQDSHSRFQSGVLEILATEQEITDLRRVINKAERGHKYSAWYLSLLAYVLKHIQGKSE